MTGRRVRVHPVFYARLMLALQELTHGVDAEMEVVNQHLPGFVDRFAVEWDSRLFPVTPLRGLSTAS